MNVGVRVIICIYEFRTGESSTQVIKQQSIENLDYIFNHSFHK